MTFSPVIERELRVAERKHIAFWVRLGAALLAASLLTVLFAAGSIPIFGSPVNLGVRFEFNLMKWLAFAFACGAGVFLTADCLSEEKREGTLGLLFLTPLRGFEVVLGKLLSRSIEAVCALLALLPVVAITILLGGVGGPELFRTALAVGNALLLSLAAGLFVSAISRESLKAINATLLLMLLLLAGLPLLDLLLRQWPASAPFARLQHANPWALMQSAGGFSTRAFWPQLALQHALAWGFVALACVISPRSWQDRVIRATTEQRGIRGRWLAAGRTARKRADRRLLDQDPPRWLAAREMTVIGIVWFCLVLAWSVLATVGWFQGRTAAGMAAHFCGSILAFLMMFWLSSAAAKFFVELKQTNALELLLVTPVTFPQIVRAQWRTLLRQFIGPLIALVLLQAVGGYVFISQMFTNLTPPAGITQPPGMVNFNPAHYYLANWIAGILGGLANFAALAWFGMWMGLTSRKTGLAVLKTLGIVIILPSVVFSMGTGMVFAFGLKFGLPIWLGSIVGFLLGLAKDAFFIIWSRRHLLTRHDQVIGASAWPPPLRSAPPSPLPSTVAPTPPPVL